jgi:maintenance of morphology protein 1
VAGGRTYEPEVMGSGHIFSLQPTFTQGFILGQFSILALLAVVLKYLFLDTEPSHKGADRDAAVSQPTRPSARVDEGAKHIDPESTEWLNALLHQVCKYRQSAASTPPCTDSAFTTRSQTFIALS